MLSLEAPPPPLGSAQRLLFWLTAAGVALTRLIAVSKTLWDWDEVQFAFAVRDYDPAAYHPHPPGFPLFIAAAKLIRPLAADDFRAVQVIVVVSSMFLFPALFLLCREIRFPFATAYSGALLSAFLPNVWFYGGTAFSDIPSLVVTAAACALLLRGVRDRSALFAGALVLGVAASMRPQAVLFALAPAMVVAWIRRRNGRDLVAALSIGLAVIAVSYAAAVLASSSTAGYLESTRRLRTYLREVDSFVAPGRPPLLSLAPFFFFRSIPGDAWASALAMFAAAGLIVGALRRDRAVVLLMTIFLPFQLFAWVMLDFYSVTRYGVAFAPMYAILAASAFASLAVVIPRGGAVATIVVTMIFAGAFAAWTMPALTEVRRNASPPVMAMRFLEKSARPDALLFVHTTVVPYAKYFLGDRAMVIVDAPRDIGDRDIPTDAVVVSEIPSPALSASRFVRGRGRLYRLVRARYFEVTVQPVHAWVEFGDGWHGLEWHSEVAWLWMAKRSVMKLPPVEGAAELQLQLAPAMGNDSPKIRVEVNGRVVEEFELRWRIDKKWIVDALPDRWNEVVITSDRVTVPSFDGLRDDARELSLQLTGFDWAPAR